MSRRNLATGLDRDIAQMPNRQIQEAMAHGITNDMIYGGLLAGQTALQGLRSTSLTQNCLYGSRRVTWDGDVYKYAYPSTISVAGTGNFVRPGMGAKNYHNPGFLNVTGGNINARTAGDTTIRILLDATSGAALWFGTAYNMVGAKIVFAGLTPPQTFSIIAHDVGDDGDTIEFTLDGVVQGDIAAASQLEITPNAYTCLMSGGNQWTSVVGVPAAPMPTLYSGWIQTWGILWVTPGVTGVGSEAEDRTVIFHNDGSLHQWDDDDPTSEGNQIAGFISHMTTTGDWANPPFIMLQISP